MDNLQIKLILRWRYRQVKKHYPNELILWFLEMVEIKIPILMPVLFVKLRKKTEKMESNNLKLI